MVVGAEPQQACPEQRRAVGVDELQAFLLGCQLRLPEQERLNAGISDRRLGCEIFDDEG